MAGVTCSPGSSAGGPECPRMAVFTARIFQPLSSVAHEVAEASALVVQRGGKKGEVVRREFTEVF